MSVLRLPPLVIALTWTALSFQARAQSLNVDCGSNPTYSPTPSASYGAAAGQPGFWNGVSAVDVVATPMPLLGLDGGPSGVTLQRITYIGMENDHYDDPALTGDEAALGNDIWYSATGHGGPADFTYELAGLRPGDYRLYTYTHDPLYSAITRVAVPGSSDPAQVSTVMTTHAVHVTTGTISFVLSIGQGWEIACSGFQLVQLGGEFASACAGDGTGAACPCGNSGAPGHGCANSLDPQGALLAGNGIAGVSHDSFVLTGSSVANAVTVTFQCDVLPAGGAGIAMNDGVFCLGGVAQRIATRNASSNSFAYPGPGDVPISVRGGVPPLGGTRYYQTVYRNAATFCTPETRNYTNAVRVEWAP